MSSQSSCVQKFLLLSVWSYTLSTHINRTIGQSGCPILKFLKCVRKKIFFIFTTLVIICIFYVNRGICLNWTHRVPLRYLLKESLLYSFCIARKKLASLFKIIKKWKIRQILYVSICFFSLELVSWDISTRIQLKYHR